MFINLLRLFSSEIDTARNQGDIQENKPVDEEIILEPVKVPVKFKADISALEGRYGTPLPETIPLTLTEALELLPRDRKRSDAYNSLKHYLEGIGVNLIINSNKTKKS